MDFSKIASFFGEVTATDNNLAAKIDQAKEKLSALKAAPLSREDYIRYGQASITAIGQRYLGALKDQSVADRQRDPVDLAVPFVFFPVLNPGPGKKHSEVTTEAICWMFGDQMREQFAKAVAELDWPAKCGPALKVRLEQIAALESEITNLQQQRDKIRTDANAAGIPDLMLPMDAGKIKPRLGPGGSIVTSL
jgi:hypothetical protein